jgi:hypothetical protein
MFCSENGQDYRKTNPQNPGAIRGKQKGGTTMKKKTMKMLIPDMPYELHMAIKMEAIKQDTTLKVLVKKILKEYMSDKA